MAAQDSNMRRRDFIIVIVGSALTCLYLARAQQNGRITRHNGPPTLLALTNEVIE
jgi:hypothetical protein